MEVWKLNEDEREESSIIDRGERLQEAYENRCRFARQIDVHEGKEYQLSLRNRGFCVVTFSTSEECQNYYFTHGADAKMELVGDKLEFEYDPLFRKEILRIVDNEHLQARKQELADKLQQKEKFVDIVGPTKEVYEQSKYQLNAGRNFESYHLFERIMRHIFLKEGLSKTEDYTIFKEFIDANDFMDWEDRQRKFREAKGTFETKTFDELAEIELYGRVLPKDSKIERIKLEETKYKVPEEIALIEEHNLMLDTREIRFRDKFYDRQRERNNRLVDLALGITHEGEAYEGEVQEGVEESE